MKIKKGCVYLVKINPSNSGLKKTRPCVVVQDNRYNNVIGSSVVIPLSSSSELYKRPQNIVEVSSEFLDSRSSILTHLITSVSDDRFVKEIGRVSDVEYKRIVNSVLDLIE